MASKGTPFIAFQGPLDLSSYNRHAPPSEQPSSISRIFLDAMAVREAVFVHEQGVPLDNELDTDDARSCHWVVYASVSSPDAETTSVPIGTLRLVPFPHPPHPVPGGRYVAAAEEQAAPGAEAAASFVVLADALAGAKGLVSDSEGTSGDRATSLHDGREPYVKLGRLAVLSTYRGHKIGRMLVEASLEWLRANPTFFDPSVAAEGFDRLGIKTASEIPRFAGLICAHAQEEVQGAWKKMGFEVDDKMGKWWEEGIPHVGMWLRVVSLIRQASI